MDTISVAPRTESPERLDEDLQIVHATLSAIMNDVQSYSGAAGVDIAVALSHVNAAHNRLAQLHWGPAG